MGAQRGRGVRVPSVFRQRPETGTRWRKVPKGVDIGQQGCQRIRAGGDARPLTSSATDPLERAVKAPQTSGLMKSGTNPSANGS
jgi:hypothetical protein